MRAVTARKPDRFVRQSLGSVTGVKKPKKLTVKVPNNTRSEDHEVPRTDKPAVASEPSIIDKLSQWENSASLGPKVDKGIVYGP